MSSHPITAAVDAIDAALVQAADVDPLYLPMRERSALLTRVAGEIDRLIELKLRLLARSDDVAEEHGARSPGVWVAHETDCWPAAGRRDDKQAAALARHESVRRAVVDGRASLDQALVVVAAVEAIPTDLGPDLIAKAETHLIGECAEHGPKQLRRLGEAILDVVAPDVADEAEERRLRDLEANASDDTRLSLVDRGDGRTGIAGTIPTTTAAILRAQLQAFTSPRRVATGVDDASGARLPFARQQGEAFCALIETRSANLPDHGGTAVSVVATVDHDRLRAGVGAAQLTTGEKLSAGETRRLACQMGVLPAVLDSRSQVLDLGRRKRLFTRSQRKALAIRDRGCRAHGCDIPAAWTEAHHRQPWSAGGKTDLDDGVLLCSRHHHLIHDHRYDHHWHPNGEVTFHRRT